MQYIFVILSAFIFIGCSIKNPKNIVIQDLVNIPQDIQYYTNGIDDKELYEKQKDFEKSYFRAWNIQKPSQTLEETQWAFKYFDNIQSYGENLRPVSKEFFDEIYKESNFDEYLTLNKKALTLKYTSIRALPTTKPLLRDPSMAGEGFPFDYLQNSSINANVPLFVSHYSKDKQWVYVFSSFANGWIKSREIVFIDDGDVWNWKSLNKVYATKEGEALYGESGEFLFNTRIGMLFPLIDEDETSYTILTVSKFKSNEPLYSKSKISKSSATKKILSLNEVNLNKIIKEVSVTNYGWGGLYEQRDCSSMLMDMYVPFGIWLPRNSSVQSKIGQVIDLTGLSNSQKIKEIKEKAIPFETFLYKKGHIVLYVGTYNEDIIIFHNTWGVKTKNWTKEGRFIIGGPIFSTLKLGSELKNYDESAEILKNIKSMNIITRRKPKL